VAEPEGPIGTGRLNLSQIKTEWEYKEVPQEIYGTATSKKGEQEIPSSSDIRQQAGTINFNEGLTGF